MTDTTVDLWGEELALVDEGYDPAEAQALAGHLAFAVASLTRRLVTLQRQREHLDVLTAWYQEQVAAARNRGSGPTPSQEDLRTIAFEHQARADGLIGELREAGLSERLLMTLSAQLHARLRTAIFTDEPVEAEFTLPLELDGEDAAASLPQSATGPILLSGRVTIRMTPLANPTSLQLAQDMLAQFADALVVKDVLPAQGGADFIADVFAPTAIVTRFNRLPGAQARMSGPSLVEVTVSPELIPGPLGLGALRLGGLRTSPHGPGSVGQ